MTDVKAKTWPLDIFLKKFILHLKTKKKTKKKGGEGIGMWYIGNVLTTVVYIFFVFFFGVSSEKKKMFIQSFIIALHKSRLMPVFPLNKALALALFHKLNLALKFH